jgi:hypothetical protein
MLGNLNQSLLKTRDSFQVFSVIFLQEMCVTKKGTILKTFDK